MTDEFPDQIVSLYVDGVATSDQVREVESDPELSRRARELSEVRERVAERVVAPPEVRSDIIAAAVHESSTDVVDIRGRSWWRGRSRIVAAAAAAVALVVAVGIALFPARDVNPPEVALNETTTTTATSLTTPTSTTPTSTTMPEIMADVIPYDETTFVFDFGEVASPDEIFAALPLVEDGFDLDVDGRLDITVCADAAAAQFPPGLEVLYVAVAASPAGEYELYAAAEPNALVGSNFVLLATTDGCSVVGSLDR